MNEIRHKLSLMIDIRPFVQLGKERLEPFLAGIDNFIANKHLHPDKGSAELRAKPPEVYLRNMLAVGVLNRLMRKDFLSYQKRVIVLPDCLKNYDEWTCCKAELDGAPVCTQCNSDCFVFEAMERFADDHTTIVLEPDELSKYFDRIVTKHGRVGVVGVACALTLLSGFKATLVHKLPTQGIFLNYASCGHHWADPAYNTSFSYRRMSWVLDKNNNAGSDPISFAGRGETYSLVRHPNSPDDFYLRLDELATIFEKDFFPQYGNQNPKADIYELSLKIMEAIVPDLITRDDA